MPKKTKKVKEKKPEKVSGYGVVGMWRSPNKLGGMLPAYLSYKGDSQKRMIDVARRTHRFIKFQDENDRGTWLCEIIIKPIKKVVVPEFFDAII